MSWGALAKIERETDGERPCPRVLLEHDSVTAWRLVPLLVTNSPALPLVWGESKRSIPRSEREAVLDRALYVAHAETYREALRKGAQRLAAVRKIQGL